MSTCSACPQCITKEVPDATIQELLASLNLDLKQPLEKVSTWVGLPGLLAGGEPGRLQLLWPPPPPSD